MEFRNLNADEIECRVSTVKKNGCSLLLYKDSRADMILLDETVGNMNWQRSHLRENANCIVSIWDSEKAQWVGKEDTGAESFTEKEKGLASDSFKRACFNWGIGRELYTAPFIWVSDKNAEIKTSTYQGTEKFTTYDKFEVSSIEYDGKKIIGLTVINSKSKIVAYTLKSGKTPNIKPDTKADNKPTTKADVKPKETPGEVKKIDDAKIFIIKNELDRIGISEAILCSRKSYGISKIVDITEELFTKIYKDLKATKSSV